MKPRLEEDKPPVPAEASAPGRAGLCVSEVGLEVWRDSESQGDRHDHFGEGDSGGEAR